MIQKFFLPGDLKFGQYKTIRCQVGLEVRSTADDEYAEAVAEEDSVGGELHFDVPPITWSDKHPAQKTAVGELRVWDGDETSKFRVVLIEKTGERTLMKDRLKRYFWLVYAFESPIYDGLGIFPEQYKQKIDMKVYTCTDFRGIWPVGVSSVVVAKDKKEAKTLLVEALAQAGVIQPEVQDCTLQELDLRHPKAMVLNTGSY